LVATGPVINHVLEALAILGNIDTFRAGTQNIYSGSRKDTARLSGVWPPNCTITPIGFSNSIIFMISSKVSGSK